MMRDLPGRPFRPCANCHDAEPEPKSILCGPCYELGQKLIRATGGGDVVAVGTVGSSWHDGR